MTGAANADARSCPVRRPRGRARRGGGGAGGCEDRFHRYRRDDDRGAATRMRRAFSTKLCNLCLPAAHASGSASVIAPRLKPRCSTALRPMCSISMTWRCAVTRARCWCRRSWPRRKNWVPTGAQMLDAYVAGYEVWANLVDREKDMHHAKGWHPTGVFGAVGAAAACASHCAGSHRNNAAMRSDWAHRKARASCRTSVRWQSPSTQAVPRRRGSCLRASRRRVSPPSPTRSSTRRVFSPPCPRAAMSNASGRRPTQSENDWLIVERRMSLKKYPTCFYTHRALDAILSLMSRTRIDHAQVVRVEVLDQPRTRNGAPQPCASRRARGQVQHAVRDGRSARRRQDGIPGIAR